MKYRFHRYFYADPSHKREVRFEERSYFVILSTAYDVGGLVGSEVNGIVILDNDHRRVVLDEHMKVASGMLAPSPAQVAELDRITGMDWSAFSRFVREHLRYRGGFPDLDHPSGPDRGDAINQAIAKNELPPATGRDIRTPEMIQASADPDVPYDFPLKTRDQMIAALLQHPTHYPAGAWNAGLAFSWNIKVGSFDDSASKGDKFDAAWQAHLEDHGDMIFNEAAENGIRHFVEGDYTTWPGDDQGRYRFCTAGRSGGHLILSNWTEADRAGWKDRNMIFRGTTDMREWLDGIEDTRLAKLYKLIATVDHDTRPEAIKNEMSYQYAQIRENLLDQGTLDETKSAYEPARKHLSTNGSVSGPVEVLREGVEVVRAVMASWESGDLAGAVNRLSEWADVAEEELGLSRKAADNSPAP